MSPPVVAEIDAMLESIKRSQDITIPWAIESGSRAWGFPSPDSDYDCRFIYVRRPERYLTLWPDRDVIKTPLERELDVNGWDLGKAIKLMLKGNAVVIEWLLSPIIYKGDALFRDEFIDFANRFSVRTLIARHYLHLGERVRRTYLTNSDEAPSKKLFYALRPAAALRWMRRHPNAPIAPMHFPTLVAESDLPPALSEIISDLLAQKALTRELGTAPIPALIDAFITQEIDLARDQFETELAPIPPSAKSAADDFFRRTVRRFA